MTTKQYPDWVWDSYDARPSWAYEATIHEWAERLYAHMNACGRTVSCTCNRCING